MKEKEGKRKREYFNSELMNKDDSEKKNAIINWIKQKKIKIFINVVIINELL